MKHYAISNLAELQQKRMELKLESEEKLNVLKDNFSETMNKFTIKGFLGEHITKNSLTQLDSRLGISNKFIAVALPLLLNSTLFRNAGFISKMLVNITGNKIGKQLDLENITGVIALVKSYFNGDTKKAKAPTEKTTLTPRPIQFGIPPDSETY